jgi:hypothetical protein
MRKLLLISFLLINLKVKGQIIAELKPIIDTLCSPLLAGRGYVDNGCNKAGIYVVDYFKSIGIEDNNIQIQNYQFNVNTFPNSMRVVINDNQLLKPGIDFIVDAASAKAHFNKKIVQHIALEKIQHIDSIVQLFNSLCNHHYAYVLDSFDLLSNKLVIKKDDLLKLLPKGLFIIPSSKKFIWDVASYNLKASVVYINEQLVTSTTKTIKINIDQKLEHNSKQKNIVAIIPGKSDSMLVFSAHYDHLGKMGKDTYFPGASDNASGTAMMLLLANYYSKQHANNYTMVFMAFSGEEAGLLGSHFFIEHPLIDLKKIKFMTNIDIAGDATNGITVVNGSVFKNEFNVLNSINSTTNLLPEIRIRGKAAISDHYFFSEKNIPCFFIYTNGGKGYYHDVFDQAKELSLNNINELFNLMTEFYSSL